MTDSINYFRLIFAILVVAIHVPPFGTGNNVWQIELNFFIQNCLARIAVPFFFMVTGYFVFKERDLNFQGVKKRIEKMVRLYCVWSLLYLPFSIEALLRAKEGTLHMLLDYIRRFLFYGSYVHLWYNIALITAVIVITILLKKNFTIEQIVIASFILYVIGLLGQSWYGVLNLIPMVDIYTVYEKIFITTRNGIFFAFIFVALGAHISQKPRIVKSWSVYSIILGCIYISEVYLLRYLGWMADCDMYLTLVPLMYCLFQWILQLKVKSVTSKINNNIRFVSEALFLTHIFVREIVKMYFAKFCPELMTSSLCFGVVLCLSLGLAMLLLGMKNRNSKIVKVLF